jgi:hypothetical protein
MVHPDIAVARAAAGSWGVLSLDELLACGLTRSGVKARARKGWLHRRHRGVYAVGHPNLPLTGRFLAAVKACGPRAVLSHFSAAVLWAVVAWDGRHPEVTVIGSGGHVQPGIRVHRTLHLDGEDLTWHDGVPVTSPARTLVDLASVLDYRRLRRAVRQALSLRLVSPGSLLGAIERAGRRPGRRNLLRIVATSTAPTRSELEDVVLDLILAGGLEHPDVNVPLELQDRRVVPDFRWPRERLVIEADGAKWHENPIAREDDAERQALLEASGERVVRVTWQQAVAHPGQTLARFRAAGAPSTHPLSS